MNFWWWDDAMAVANGNAAVKGIRHKVKATDGGLWAVQEVEAA